VFFVLKNSRKNKNHKEKRKKELSLWQNLNGKNMTQTGISIEKTETGHPAYIKFDYDKYAGLLQIFLQSHNISFPLKPNDTTRAAIEEAQNYHNLTRYNSAESLLADCLKD